MRKLLKSAQFIVSNDRRSRTRLSPIRSRREGLYYVAIRAIMTLLGLVAVIIKGIHDAVMIDDESHVHITVSSDLLRHACEVPYNKPTPSTILSL